MSTTLASSLTATLGYTYSKTNAGTKPTSVSDTFSSKVPVGTNVANGAVGGGDTQYGPVILNIAASGNTTLDLSGALTDLLGNASLAFARVKAILVELLSASTTLSDGTVGTACSSITVGAAASNPALVGSSGFINGTTPVFNVFSGGFAAFAAGNAGGVAVANSSSDQLKIVNNDGSNAAVIRLTVLGASS